MLSNEVPVAAPPVVAPVVAGENVPPPLHPILPVQCVSFLPKGPRRKNVRYATSKKADLRRWSYLTLFGPMHNKRMSFVGGGPSLNETYKEITGDVMVLGSCHDHAVRLGIKPTYSVECDPTLDQIKFYKENPQGCKYLLASRCDKSMFDHLKGRDIYLWHMWEQDLGKPVYKGEPAFVCGATVFLAAIPIALALGYREFHFYGIDSSFPNKDNHHAYPEVAETSQMIEVKVGDQVKGRTFLTTATWIGQGQQYQDMWTHWGHMFKAEFHGDGMLAEMERCAGRQK